MGFQDRMPGSWVDKARNCCRTGAARRSRVAWGRVWPPAQMGFVRLNQSAQRKVGEGNSGFGVLRMTRRPSVVRGRSLTMASTVLRVRQAWRSGPSFRAMAISAVEHELVRYAGDAQCREEQDIV